MKKYKFLLSSICFLFCLHSVVAQKKIMKNDSLKTIQLKEMVVSGIRANNKAPFSFTNLKKKTIRQKNSSQQIPYLIELTPSIVATSEDGIGTGNTSFRVRGSDMTRINVTINGMPLNNPETQGVYWINLPDLGSRTQSIQLQRGVGSSTNGAAAFGATMSIRTSDLASKAHLRIKQSVGNYGFRQINMETSTGLMKNGFNFGAAASINKGKGYIDNGKINGKSFSATLSHSKENSLCQLTYIYGQQNTGITWNGITPQEMKEFGRRYNSAGLYGKKNQFRYKNDTDNYFSSILQATYSKRFSQDWIVNANFSINKGFGYYENYKKSKSFSSYDPKTKFLIINNDTIKKSDFIVRQCMDNIFYVGNLNSTYSFSKGKLKLGAMYSLYDGGHFGNVLWSKYNAGTFPEDYRWYKNKAIKSDINAFAKLEWTLSPRMTFFADVQGRLVNYSMWGKDNDFEMINSKNHYKFFNPKTGFNFSINKNNHLFASVAIGNKEPLRTDLKDSMKKGKKNEMRPERLYDFEAGYRFINENMFVGVTLYQMIYHDQLVETGRLSSVGYKLMENVKHSYRQGIELETKFPILKNLSFGGNLTLSRNKIKDYTAHYKTSEPNKTYKKQLGDVDISFSPGIIGSAILEWKPIEKMAIRLTGKYVGSQYLTNTNEKEASFDKSFSKEYDLGPKLDAYFVNNLGAAYEFKLFSKKATFEAFINNIFNKQYISSGTYDLSYSERNPTDASVPYIYKGLYPQATRNVMFHLTINI